VTVTRVRVRLPAPLRELASLPAEVVVEVEDTVTQRSVLDALESSYPVLRGALRDRVTGRRRPFVRFFAGGADLSNDPPEEPLPAEVAGGKEPLIVLGAIAGG
jgi:molybdopterin synthase sulfur carrier subunit